MSDTETNFLQWDDATLGQTVKKLAANILDRKGNKSLAYTACATMLACMCAERNAEETVMELEGVSDRGNDVGNWKIVISRSAASKVVGRIPRH